MTINHRRWLPTIAAIIAVFPALPMVVRAEPSFKASLLRAEQISDGRLENLAAAGRDSVVILLDPSNSPETRRVEKRAVEQIESANLRAYYWVEVARSRELADKHPNWMASLQGHDQWRRLFPDALPDSPKHVTKVYPWVPILNREPFDAQLARLKQLLSDRPTVSGIFLNDLQGAPSACGCGNTLCRWTSDYGPKRATEPLGPEAAAQFLAKIREIVADPCEVIPVWTTECEEHDGAADGNCAGVGCFRGICWKAYTRQLMPVANTSSRLAVLAPIAAFDRQQSVYSTSVGWLRFAVRSFRTMPAQHGGRPIDAARLLVVIQGWGDAAPSPQKQTSLLQRLGVGGYIIAESKIEQDWRPMRIRHVN